MAFNMDASLLVVVVLCCASAVLSLTPPHQSPSSPVENFPWADDGIVNPPSYYQRYRRSEYPKDEPFFQWFYYYMGDLANNNYFFMTFGIDETHKSEPYFKFLFGQVDAANGIHWQKTEQFSVSVVEISEYYDLKATDPTTGELMYHLQEIDNDTLRIYGSMNHTANVLTDQCKGIDPATVISFDVTYYRIHGWFGQQDLERLEIDFAEGMIGWNTYTHNSIIEGSVTIAGVTHTFENTTQFRGYGDMNYGERFNMGPSLDEAMDYAWGWFTAHVPNEDPTMDFSLVVGNGKTYYELLGNVTASFADFRFNGTHLGVREVLATFDIPVLTTSSIGELKSFTTVPSNFVDFVEGNCTFSVPLVQTVSIETTVYNVLLVYTAELSQLNRLAVSYVDTVISDFEGLGTTVQITIDYTDDNGNTTTLYDFTTNTGGYEFGYETGADSWVCQ